MKNTQPKLWVLKGIQRLRNKEMKKKQPRSRVLKGRTQKHKWGWVGFRVKKGREWLMGGLIN